MSIWAAGAEGRGLAYYVLALDPSQMMKKKKDKSIYLKGKVTERKRGRD